MPLQLHRPYGHSPLSGLPRRLREQPQLRMADPVRTRQPHPPGLQRFWLGGSVRHLDREGWRDPGLQRPGPFHGGGGAVPPYRQQQHSTAGISGRSFDVGPGFQHHLHQCVEFLSAFCLHGAFVNIQSMNSAWELHNVHFEHVIVNRRLPIAVVITFSLTGNQHFGGLMIIGLIDAYLWGICFNGFNFAHSEVLQTQLAVKICCVTKALKTKGCLFMASS